LVSFYKEADIFVLPSITRKDYNKEGIPGTIVEAMASGLPVVTTKHAGIPEIIHDYKEGILVKERDIEGIAMALEELLVNVKLRASLGKRASEKAYGELNLINGTKRLEAIYDKVINNYNLLKL